MNEQYIINADQIVFTRRDQEVWRSALNRKWRENVLFAKPWFLNLQYNETSYLWFRQALNTLCEVGISEPVENLVTAIYGAMVHTSGKIPQ